MYLLSGDDEMAGKGALQAAYVGNLQLLTMLILEGHCNVNQQDKAGSTAAHKGDSNKRRCNAVIFFI